jgi:NAD(P)-dependent dehydrogenase (short-subunit alcohol dehydrogenase family)
MRPGEALSSHLLRRVLDPTIVFSFDRTGFGRHAATFDAADMSIDLVGRTFVVTGANAGIGKEVTRGLAARGAHVAMLCRSEARGEAARLELLDDPDVERGGGVLTLVVCDVSDLRSVDAAFGDLPFSQVDALVHNAGVLVDKRVTSPQGIELTLATHLVGPLRATSLALDRMTRSGRVVWVSSGGMYTRRLSVDRLERATGAFDGVTVYADVKRAQVVVSELLAGKLRSRGILSNAMHPGWAATKGVQESIPGFYRWTRRILRTPAEGADTVLWLAASPRVAERTGEFFFDREAVPTHLMPFTREPTSERERLWSRAMDWAELSEDAFDAVDEAAPGRDT